MPSRLDAFGQRGEDAAARYLEGRGLRILERRVRTRFGEIDLIAEDSDVVAFVEVKTRSGSAFGAPAEAVGARKAEALRRSASSLIASRREFRGRRFRIDVVEVFWPKAGQPQVHHIEDAVGEWG